MKAIFRRPQKNSVHVKKLTANQRAYWTAIGLVSLACGGNAMSQTNNVPIVITPPVAGSSTNAIQLPEVTVASQLDVDRNNIMPELGATVTTLTHEQILSGSQGDNAPINQLILRAPGVAQDSAANGDLHVRGEHANLQYRINGVLLPEGITGFGLELEPRFIDSVKLITGSLPAQYGFRTAGVVDIQTKSGSIVNGGEAEIYGGSHDTIRPSFEIGGTTNNFSYFLDGSYEHNSLGIENTTGNHDALHDKTDQGKFFSYMSYVIDDASRVSLMLSASDSNFQIPDTAGLQNDPANFSSPGGNPWQPGTFDSATLNERQNEQNYYATLTYQKSAGDFNIQVSVIGRESSVHFMPDVPGDLFFNGVASDEKRTLYSGGLQADASYNLGDKHTIRAGAMFIGEFVRANSTSKVIPLDGAGNPNGAPFAINDNNSLHGLFTGFYLQDEWKIFSKLTLNFGARFDVFNSSFDNESQISPRVNLIYEPTESTTLHAGYSRYFTPPPVENVSGSSVARFDGTSGSTGNDQDDPVKAERADYYDLGITQKVLPGLKVGVDGYYKKAKNQLDDGLFGQTLILSAFNYAEGEVYGSEFTMSYDQGGFSSYANVAYSVARGKEWNSSQFLFGAGGPGMDLNYVQNNWIALDHDQRVTGSFGMSYLWKESPRSSTRFLVDAIYGSGLRTDATASDGSNIPNGGTVPAYYSVNCGVEQSFKLSKLQALKARIDMVNLTDHSYELRDGSGVGVNAAQFGARRGIFGSLSYVF